MPGIIGFSNLNSREQSGEGFINRMANALEPESRFKRYFLEEQGVGIGIVALDLPGVPHQPVWNDTGTLCAFMEGELFDTQPLKDRLRKEKISPDPEGGPRFVLQLYEVFGEDFVKDLNGAFLIAIWDRTAQKIILMNDRLGLYPLYYAQSSTKILFGSGVRALLADATLERTPDPIAIAQFLTFDHMLGDRTQIQQIRLVPQASILTIQDNTLKIQPYWQIQYPENYEHHTEEELIEEFLYLMKQAVSRQSTGAIPMGMLLSGGLDSRVILAYLMSEGSGSNFHTFTWGIPGCDDARISQEVASKLGTTHHFFELKPDYLISLADEAIRITDGLGNIINLHALATLDAEVKYAQIIFKGFLGDAMFGFAVRRPFWAEYTPATAHEVHMQTHSDQGVINHTQEEKEELFSEPFNEAVNCAIYDTYQAGMAASNARLLAAQRLYFDYTQRVPRMTLNGVEVVRSQARVRLPFCDNDLVNFSLQIPPGFHFERYLIRTAFARAFPDLAKIPLADTGLPMISCARDVYIQTKKLVRWHLNQRGFARFTGPERKPYKDYNTWFRNELKDWIEETLLSQQSLKRGYFKPATIKKLVSEHMAGANHTTKLAGLITIERWHQQFID